MLYKTFTSKLPVIGILFMLVCSLAYIVVTAYNFRNNSNSDLPKYSEIRIFATTENDFQKMADNNLDIDHANRKPGQWIDAWLSEQEIELLKKSGVPYQVLIEDWYEYYERQPKMTETEMNAALLESYERDNITHSIYGTMGGYLKYSEVVQKLDSLRIQYPTLISQKFSIGTSHESRTIWCVRVTKNPDAPTGRPQVMYHALIHAREPNSMEHELYYIYWLVENYNIDPIATYILNNREIYWIPVFNPDGYVYNETTNPNGGGMWRKNRKPCGSGTGTDLNRNYGIYQFWNSTNNGSSSSCSSDTYRGSSPFSEPETQAIMNFVNSRNLQVSWGAHTYGNYIIKPWAWCDPIPTPDDYKFNEYLADMRASNGYTVGTPYQTVGYYVRGGSDDWYYQDSVHNPHHIIAFTPESGTSFWPAQNQILPIAQTMLYSNQYVSLIAGPYVLPLSRTFNQPSYTPGASGNFKVRFRNKGVMTAANVRVQWTSPSSYITIPVTQYTYPSLASFAVDSSTFNFSVSSSAQNNCAYRTVLTIKLDTTTIYTENVYVMVGTGSVVLNDNAETGFGNWTTTQGWNTTTSQYNSPTHSFTDSPTGNYLNNADNSMALVNPINVSSVPVVYLSFWHKYATEPGYDFCRVEVSSNNGSTWTQIAQYDGTQTTWTQQTFDITSYANASSQLKIRFRLTSDVSLVADGWYVDDVKLTGYCNPLVGITTNNQIPDIFTLKQNYPNPFNPATLIKYQLPKDEFVTLKIFDILGKEIFILVNEKKEAGTYEIRFDGTNFASGVYFYRIQAGDFMEVRKMMLMK